VSTWTFLPAMLNTDITTSKIGSQWGRTTMPLRCSVIGGLSRFHVRLGAYLER
jgi:hypothetical protein